MSKETRLQKDFTDKDLSRIRNLIKKDFGAKTQTQVGWEKEIIEHNEGDIWEDNGKKWTIKNGIKQSISKLDEFKDQYHIPFGCPKCKKPLNKTLDGKMYRIHKQCFECVVNMETQLKIEGKYEVYKNHFLKSNVLYGINEFQAWLEEETTRGNDKSMISENGELESWNNNNNKEVKDKITNEILPELDAIRKTWLDEENVEEDKKE